VKTFERIWRLKTIFRHNKGGAGCSSLWRCSQQFRIDRGWGRVLSYIPHPAISACHSQDQEIADVNTHTLYFNTCWSNNETSETWSCLGILCWYRSMKRISWKFQATFWRRNITCLPAATLFLHYITYDKSNMTSLCKLRHQSRNTTYMFVAVRRYQLQGVLELHTVCRWCRRVKPVQDWNL